MSDPTNIRAWANRVLDTAETWHGDETAKEAIRALVYQLNLELTQQEKLTEALQKLYDYTVSLEAASAPWFATRSFAKVPDGGEEAGKLTRTALGIPEPE